MKDYHGDEWELVRDGDYLSEDCLAELTSIDNNTLLTVAALRMINSNISNEGNDTGFVFELIKKTE